MGGPMFMAIGFSLVGLWMVFALLPGLRPPPIASKTKSCPACSAPNLPDAPKCEKCGGPMAPSSSPPVDKAPAE